MEAPGDSTGHSKESEVKEARMNIIKQTRERFSRFFYRFPEGESSADVSSFLESVWREIDMNRTRINRDNGSSDLKRKQRGLSFKEADERLKKVGPNVPVGNLYSPWWELFWNAFWHPFNIILFVLSALCFVAGDKANGSIMVVMVILSVSLRFYQEFSSSKAALKLSELVKASIKVQRCAGRVVQTELQVQIDQKDVVPGDIIIFSSGDLFPGDVRLLSSQAVVVSQSSLMGESGIVEKTADIIEEPNTPLLELRNICFMGTSVVSGSGTGVVVSTGEKTYISTILSALGRQSPPDAFEKGVKRVSYMLICFMLVIVPIIVTVDYLTTHDWGRSVLFGITVAVGLTPQMLPLIVNTNLAKGAFAMARDKCIVKRLVAIQNMGSMDVLCTDKTGTLTMDRVVMVHHLDSWGMSSDKILYFTFLNSYFQTGFKNPLDDAILAYVYTGGYKFEPTKWIRINELPFDFSRRRMSVILEEINHNHVHRNKHPLLVERIMVTKGAYEEVLKVCSFFQKDIHDDSLEPLSSQDYQRLFNMGEELSNDGLCVIGFAKRKLKPVCSDYLKILKKFFVCQNNAQDSKVSEGASSNAITNSSNDGSHGHVCNSGPLVVITTPLKRWTPSKCVPLAPIHVQATISPQTKAKVGQPRKIRIKGETSH